MSLPNYPPQKVKEFGEKVSQAMFNAACQYTMGALGGNKHYDLNNFDEDVRPYIAEYLRGRKDSVAITYAAMRDKELEMRECNHKCNQGRDCTCATCYSNWSAKVVIYIFLITAIVFIVL